MTPLSDEPKQEVFVPVHGEVKLLPQELVVIDHPAFQRLGHVRQLGLAHFVFRGAMHTRFEHSIGAVHVAQIITDHINENAQTLPAKKADSVAWSLLRLNDETVRFVRLGALLHDLGHLPLGHTLEDELNHLGKHDGTERFLAVAGRGFLGAQHRRHYAHLEDLPASGGTLSDVIEHLYAPFAAKLEIPVPAVRLLCLIICKPPKHGAALEEWNHDLKAVQGCIHLDVCRDIVGNTICADFLDYLYRDWYHIGRPIGEDSRLYQYMEVRQPQGNGQPPRFVINVGTHDRPRHDALTAILRMLAARYELAEIALFHRTKLALTGILDRCLLEIANVYRVIGLSDDTLPKVLESLLLDGSDDGLANVLEQLSNGHDPESVSRLSDHIRQEREQLARSVPREQDADPGNVKALFPQPENASERASRFVTPLEMRRELVAELLSKFRTRHIYRLAFRFSMSDAPGQPDPKNATVSHIIKMYADRWNRWRFLNMLEALCGLPPGSIVMYCPQEASMNAKVAEVNLFVDNEIVAFNAYEEARKDHSLTGGMLDAQVSRFFHLWSVQIYVESAVWSTLSTDQRTHLKDVIEAFLLPFVGDQSELRAKRKRFEYSIQTVQGLRVARRSTRVDSSTEYHGLKFPNDMPFSVDLT